jgi:hypothetical protein
MSASVAPASSRLAGHHAKRQIGHPAATPEFRPPASDVPDSEPAEQPLMSGRLRSGLSGHRIRGAIRGLPQRWLQK